MSRLCHFQANSTANATFIVEVGKLGSVPLEGSDFAVCQIFAELHGLTRLTAWMQDRPDLPFTDLSWVDHGCRAYEANVFRSNVATAPADTVRSQSSAVCHAEYSMKTCRHSEPQTCACTAAVRSACSVQQGRGLS